MEHQLLKNEKRWLCKVCKRNWKTKPVSACVGIENIPWDTVPDGFKSESDLHKINLKPTGKPRYYHHSMRGNHRLLYDYKETETNIPDLPKILTKAEKDKRGYLTVNQLRKQNYIVGNAKPACAVWFWNRDTEMGDWAYFWDKQDCEWQAADSWLSKSTLKKIYLLSEGWIKKLGAPDREIHNPHSYSHPIKLYSRQRVEFFIAERAQEYSEWLDKRDRYVQIFEQNRDKIKAGQEKLLDLRNLLKDQQSRCLRCASSAFLGNGIFCAIYPSGLENDQIPCKDFYEREV